MEKVIISQQYLESVTDFNIMQQMISQDFYQSQGDIQKIADNIYLLKDENGGAVCNILDGQTFYEALMQSDVSGIFSNFN